VRGKRHSSTLGQISFVTSPCSAAWSGCGSDISRRQFAITNKANAPFSRAASWFYLPYYPGRTIHFSLSPRLGVHHVN